VSGSRHRTLLRQRYRAIVAYTGLVLLIAAGLILSTLLVVPFYPGEARQAPAFLIPGGMVAVAGALLWHWFRPRGGATLTWQEGAVVVVLAWAGSILAAAAVFMLAQGLTFTQAVFEATSGWTTTGLSVVDVTATSHVVLLFRSNLELAGGAGLAIIMLSALVGPAGAGLSSAEGRSDQLAPHVRRSAGIVLALYSAYAVGGTLALRLAGMRWFDAVNHSFAAVSTGGFSTRPESIGYWNSPAIEAVTIVLMLLGTLNFLTSWALARGKLRAFLKNGEVRLLAVLLLAGAVVVFSSVAGSLYASLGKAARVAFFEVASAASTTGFSTVGYLQWGPLPVFVLIGLMIVGGGTGSTAGGLKQYRVYVLFRALWWELQRGVSPATTVSTHAVWVGEERRFVDDRQIRSAAVFVFVYMVAFGVGSGILMGYGYGMRESLFEFASALGTVGLSVGVTAPDAPAGVLWTETAGMLLGRLEFFTVIVGVMRLATDGLAASDRTGE